MVRRVILCGLLLIAPLGCRRGVDAEKLGQLMREVESTDARMALHAAEELATLGPAAAPAVPALIRQLGSGRSWRAPVNAAATNALLRIGPRAALPPWVAAVQGQDRDVALGAIFTLGGFGAAAKAARPALLTALEDPQLQGAANRALRQIDGEEK